MCMKWANVEKRVNVSVGKRNNFQQKNDQMCSARKSQFSKILDLDVWKESLWLCQQRQFAIPCENHLLKSSATSIDKDLNFLKC